MAFHKSAYTCPNEVQQKMQNEIIETEDNKRIPMFTHKEYLEESQIASYFSNLAKKQRNSGAAVIKTDFKTKDEEDARIQEEKEILKEIQKKILEDNPETTFIKHPIRYYRTSICELVLDYRAKRQTNATPMINGCDLPFLKKAWKKFLKTTPPDDYEALAEGFHQFVEEHCGCTFIQNFTF